MFVQKNRNKICALLFTLWNKDSAFKLCQFYHKISNNK